MGMWQNYFWNRNSNIEEINRRKNAISELNIAVFSATNDLENKIIQTLHRKVQKIKVDVIVIVRTGTYL